MIVDRPALEVGVASSLAEIDDQLDALGEVPDGLPALIERYGDGDHSLAHVDELLSDMESGVQLASVPATEVARDRAPAEDEFEVDDEPEDGFEDEPEPDAADAEPEDEPVDEPEDAADASSESWDPGSSMLDGPEWSEEDAEPQTGEVAVPGATGEGSGEVAAAASDAPDADRIPRRKRRNRDTVMDAPVSAHGQGDPEGDDTPITGEFLVDDGPQGAPVGDIPSDQFDDELDDILDADEAGDDDVTTIASVEMMAKGEQPQASDEGEADVEDASDEESDSFEMLIDDDEIELIDDDELEILDD